ncbi:MAG: pantoate--beta-alanine ligase [Chloroflexi bacterium]|nr:pantoate--beta-alanine ligase [Chloroflexota bacterium]
MRVIESVAEMRTARASARAPVGLVPTMGALHDGHATLVRRARAENSTVVTSLFVNPTQFGPGEDFANYPRTRDRDLRVSEEAGTDLVFAPAIDEIYPTGGTTVVDPGPIGEVLEGKHRPGHFKGVATVVSKLFAIVRPDGAYFGEKDAQQLRIIRHINRDLRFGIEIVGVPTVRAPDGLALSSRNRYLTLEQRRAAAVLYRSLRVAEQLWRRGERRSGALKVAIQETVAAEPLVSMEYVSVADSDSLNEIEVVDRLALVSLAAHVGKARLIDNMSLPAGLSPAGTGRDV